MQLIDPNHSFYRPLWVRLLIVAFCVGWTVVELVAWQPFWAVLSGGAAAYSAYMLLFTFNPTPPAADAAVAEPDAADDDDEDGRRG